MSTKVFTSADFINVTNLDDPSGTDFDTQAPFIDGSGNVVQTGSIGVLSHRWRVAADLFDDSSLPTAAIISDVVWEADWTLTTTGTAQARLTTANSTSGLVGNGVSGGSDSGHFSQSLGAVSRAGLFANFSLAGVVLTAIDARNASAPETYSWTISSMTITVTYTLPPITIVPTLGGTLGNTPFEITGVGFLGGVSDVTFGGDSALDFVVVDDTHITGHTPAHTPPETVDCVVHYTVGDSEPTNFTYSDVMTSPVITMGAAQLVLGPPTRTLTTDASVVEGINNGTLTYTWTFVDGPYEPTISSPSDLNTDVLFDHYDPGVFTLLLTVFTETIAGTQLQSSAQMLFTIKETVPPRVSTGTVVVEYPDCATVNPTVIDDGWGGAVGLPTYAFVSGPFTPTFIALGFFDPEIFDPNIFDCYSVKACGFPDETAVYVISVTFTRADALTTTVLWRIVVYSDLETIDDGNTDDVILTVNGVQFDAQINQTTINKNLNNQPTCNFRLYNSRINVGNEVIIERGSARLFGGLCLSQGLTFDDETIPFFTPSLVGYAWHLHRERITKTYLNTSISAIVADIVTFSPHTFAGTQIQAGLETASIAFGGDFLDEALTKLSKISNPPAHWFVDDFNILHYAKVEPDNDPLPLSAFHPFFKTLSLTEDLGNVANRVVVNYNAVSTVPVEVDRDIEVDSLDGYNPSGGSTRIGANDITYAGVAEKRVTFYNNVALNISLEDVTTSDGAVDTTAGISYWVTLRTPYGETTPRWGQGVGGDFGRTTNAWKLKLEQAPTANDDLAQPFDLTAAQLNIYRNGGSTGIFVGSIPITGGPPFIDGLADDDLSFPINVWGDALDSYKKGELFKNFLTGCNGTNTSANVATVTVNDTDAQTEMATRLGGTDSGIITVVIDGGDITEDAARLLGQAYLDRVKSIRKLANWTARDDKNRPGQQMTLFFPEYQFEETLTIQSTTVQGFEKGVPHEYVVGAAPDTVTLDDLIRHNTDTITKK